MRSSGSAIGVSRVSAVSITLRSCRTLLCLRLCNKACGTVSGLAVMKMAVPGTRIGGCSSMPEMNAPSDRPPSCLIPRISKSPPRRQVTRMVNTAPASTSGNQPPSRIFSVLAPKKHRSMLRNTTPAMAIFQARHFHISRATTRNKAVSMAMEIGRASCREIEENSGVDGSTMRKHDRCPCGGERRSNTPYAIDVGHVAPSRHSLTYPPSLCHLWYPCACAQLVCLTPVFFFSSRRRHTRWPRDWSSDVCSSDLEHDAGHGDLPGPPFPHQPGDHQEQGGVDGH